MEPYRDDEFVATLESLRPEPRPEFTAELDERAAAGFPRPGRGGSAWARLRDRLGVAEPRRLALAGGAFALLAIVVATAVIASSGGGDANSSQVAINADGGRLSFDRGAQGGGNEAYKRHSAPSHGNAEYETAEAEPHGSAAGGETVYETEEPVAPSSGASGASSSAQAETVTPQSKPPSGPYASGAKHRAVERGAEMTLGTEAGEVGKAAGKVLETVHAYDGIVLDSTVSGGSEGGAGARFTLLLPSAKLGDALAAFSEIAEVRSRHEASNDITAPTITTGERLQDSHARVQSLLNQLAAAETEAEQEAVEAELAAERRQQARLKSQLSNLQRRANHSRVSLRIVSDEAPGATGGGSGWDAGSALHDAGRILSVAAGVIIVASAVLAPVALLVLLALLAHRVWLRGRRERALG